MDASLAPACNGENGCINLLKNIHSFFIFWVLGFRTSVHYNETVCCGTGAPRQTDVSDLSKNLLSLMVLRLEQPIHIGYFHITFLLIIRQNWRELMALWYDTVDFLKWAYAQISDIQKIIKCIVVLWITPQQCISIESCKNIKLYRVSQKSLYKKKSGCLSDG